MRLSVLGFIKRVGRERMADGVLPESQICLFYWAAMKAAAGVSKIS